MADHVAALDLGTTGVRCVVYDRGLRPIAAAYRELPLHYPRPGWVEQDPALLVAATQDVFSRALAPARLSPADLVALGITNQRETVVVWDRTGRPLGPAIVWQDRRTAPLCERLRAEGHEAGVREKTGLPLDPYFSATKIAWLLDHVPGLRERAERGDALVGTVDAWLLWNLVGVHATDPTNASRTLLYDLRTGSWDPGLRDLFGVPEACLPEIRPSVSVFGRTRSDLVGAPVLVGGVLGDQQAALFGHGAVEAGEAKVTWGTGAFLLMNVGSEPVVSRHGLLTTVAYALAGEVRYALEGAVFVAGAALQWLRDGLGIIGDVAQSEALAQTIPSTDGVYFVPALTGLGAPYWDPHARGTIVGLTRGTGRAHLVRAALEAIAYQTHDVVRAMEADAGTTLSELRVDGGAARNAFLCQFLADLLGIPVVRPAEGEMTARGAALAAGLSAGWWPEPAAVRALPAELSRFSPRSHVPEREGWLTGWRRAVDRARHWAQDA
ncbi:MAG: glycerol kinase GlpK [Candidatus Bipolaricaulis sp.]|nr:glycerol kinase GlpK [Candidatus Bipolaricaulis sp.]